MNCNTTHYRANSSSVPGDPTSVAIYELGEAEGIPYIAMEYVVGSGLRAFVGDRTVPLDVKVGWLVDVARALFAAHKAGLVHRDVKPGNIMVSEEGVVKVLDFGLAKPTTKADPAGFQTLMGQVLGTPRYMAPEQLEGVPADARSDQFAFGVVAYELISGIYPGGPLAGAPQPLEEIDAAVPVELSRNVLRMMARDATARFPSMDDAANALQSCVSSLRNIKVPASGDQLKRRKTTSDAPTKEHVAAEQPLEQSGAVSIDMPLGNKVITQPMPAAVGAEISRRIASTTPMNAMNPMSRPPSMKTMPLAQHGPSIPASSGHSVGPATPPHLRVSAPPSMPVSGHPSPMSFPSGVVSVNQPPPRVSVSTPMNPIAPVISSPIVAPLPAKKSSAWLVVLIVVALAAIAGGATLAWVYR